MAILHKLLFRFNAVSVKIPAVFIVQMDKLILKLKWNCKGPKYQNNLKKEEQSCGLILPNFKTHYKAIIIKTKQYWNKDRHRDQWGRNWESKTKPTRPWSTDFQQGRQKLPKEERIVFQEMVLGQVNSYRYKKEFGLLSHTIYKN